MMKAFWKKRKKPVEAPAAEVGEFDFNKVHQNDLKLMLKFGNPSNIIGNYQSKPFIELPYGIIKKDLPAYQKNDLVLESVELVMQCQFPEFKVKKASGNEIVSFLLWIKSQQEFIYEIEKQNLQSEPEPEMLAAGLHKLNDFGDMVTIDSLAKGSILEYDKIEALPYFKVYEKLKLDKVHRDIEKNYSKIMEEKSKRKK